MNHVKNVEKAEPAWVKWVGRTGYTAKGIVYAVIGVLALLYVIESGDGKVTGSRGALSFLENLPLGDVILYVIAAGLLCYTAWRWAQGFLGIEHTESGIEALVKRGGLVISGGLYALLAVAAIRFVHSAGGSGQDTQQKSQEAMSYPGGTWLVVAVGVGFILTGFYQLYRAYKDDYESHWDYDLSGDTRRWATRIASFGVSARAVIFIIMGGYVAMSGVQQDPSEAKGFGGVLKSFTDDPILLSISAIGLICYSIYSFTNAVYRRIPAEK